MDARDRCTCGEKHQTEGSLTLILCHCVWQYSHLDGLGASCSEVRSHVSHASDNMRIVLGPPLRATASSRSASMPAVRA